MPILHAIVLGITQGLSEFLPISSSGHLILVPWLFGWDDFAGNASLEKAFDVALHLGTLVGRRRLLPQGHPAVPARPPSPRPVAAPTTAGSPGCSLASAVPAAITGALFVDVIEEHTGSIPLIALMLIVFGLVLAWADSLGGTRTLESVRLRDALLMGLGQAVALQPGVSRSGVTMTDGPVARARTGRRGALRVPDEPADHGRRPPVQVVRPVQPGRHPGRLRAGVLLGDRRVGHHGVAGRVGHAASWSRRTRSCRS